jgi:hypothetical protein
MTKHYSPTRRDNYRATESKRRALHNERTLARTSKTLARAIAGGTK